MVRFMTSLALLFAFVTLVPAQVTVINTPSGDITSGVTIPITWQISGPATNPGTLRAVNKDTQNNTVISDSVDLNLQRFDWMVGVVAGTYNLAINDGTGDKFSGAIKIVDPKTPKTAAPVKSAPVNSPPVSSQPPTEEPVSSPPSTEEPVSSPPSTEEPVNSPPSKAPAPVKAAPVNSQPPARAPKSQPAKVPTKSQPINPPPINSPPAARIVQASPSSKIYSYGAASTISTQNLWLSLMGVSLFMIQFV